MKEFEFLVACMTSKEKIDRILDEDESLFQDYKSIELFKCIRSIVDSGHEIDLHNVTAYFVDIDKKQIADDIISIYATIPNVIDIESSISFLYKRRKKFKLKNIVSDIIDKIKQNVDEEEIIESVISDIDNIQLSKSNDYISVQQMASKNLDEIFTKENYIKSGIAELDEIIFAMFNTQLIILAARPGQGKSSLALDIIENIPGRTLLFSLEMPRKQLYARLLSKHSKVEAWKIKTKKMNDDEFKRVMISHNDLKSKLNIVFVDKAHDFNKITRLIKRFCDKDNIKAIVIDYLQLISGIKGENRNLIVSHISRTLKNLAIDYDIPIIALSQFSREVEKQNREPVLSDLRDSGAIEQDADVIIFLHDGKLIVAKNRDGKTGSNTIFFNKQFTTFKNNTKLINPEYFQD